MSFDPIGMAAVGFGIVGGIVLATVIVMWLKQRIAASPSGTSENKENRSTPPMLVEIIVVMIMIGIALVTSPWWSSPIDWEKNSFWALYEQWNGIVIGLLLFGVAVYGLFKGGWKTAMTVVIILFVWFIGPDTIMDKRAELRDAKQGQAGQDFPPPCTHIAELPTRKKGDYCIEMAKGGTVVVEPPPYTVAEVIPSDRVRVAFTDWKDNLMQKGGVVDPGADQWVCIPDGTKTIEVTALTDTGLRVRIGLKPITAHNCW